MPTLHDLMAQSIDERSGALRARRPSPADATRGRIARTRRRRTAMAGGSSALAVGGLVTAGAMQERAAVTPATAATPSGTAVTTEYVDVTLSSIETFWPMGWSTQLDCGQAIPDAASAADGFTLTTTSSDAVTLATDVPAGFVKSVLAYSGPDRAPMFINPGQAVLVQGSQVVATVNASFGDDAPFGPLSAGDSWDGGAILGLSDSGSVFPCASYESITSADDTALAAGEYQLYVVAQAHITEAEVALGRLNESGYVLPTASHTSLVPGSANCDFESEQAASEVNGLKVVGCEQYDATGVVLDLGNRRATVPYPAADYAGDVALHFVSAPIAVTVPRDLSWDDFGVGYLACQDPENPECGITQIVVGPNKVVTAE